MTLTINRLDATFNQPLLDLAAACDTGSGAFRVDRGPDFFALGRDLGESETWGAFLDGRLVGCISLARQARFLGGRIQHLDYIHDLRVHPEARGSKAFFTLASRIPKAAHGAWAFGTILDTNARVGTMTRGSAAFPGGRPFDRTIHLGVPMFLPRRRTTNRVVRIEASDAWPVYLRQARNLDFAPADEVRFHSGGGYFLGLDSPRGLMAIAKVMPGSPARRLLANTPPSWRTRAVGTLCRLAGRQPLPRAGEAFHHACLAYCAGDASVDYRAAFLAHLARDGGHDFPYVFLGLPPSKTRLGPAHIALHSTAYAFGCVPEGLALGFRELTLI